MAAWYAFLLVTILAILIGTGLIWLARRSLGGVFLGLAVFFLGLHFLAVSSAFIFNAEMVVAFTFVLIFGALSGGAAMAFAVVYPRIVITRGHQVVLAAVGAVTLFRLLLVLSNPSALVEGGSLSQWFWTLLSVGALGDLFVIIVLGARWLISSHGARRIQIAWGLLPFLFMALHDGLGYHFYPLIFGPRHGVEWFFPDLFTATLRVMMLLVVIGILVLAATALVRVYRGRPSGDSRALGFLTLYMLPVTLIQVFEPGFGAGGVPLVHIFLDYILVFLVVYAVARYSIVDLDLKLKWTIGRGTLAAIFLAVFFIVANVGQALFTQQLGWAIGGVAAGLLLFAIAPLQRLSARIVEAAMPGVQDSPRYRDERRATIYQAQVESLAADGQISVKERGALLRLQHDLGLDPGHANKIEAQVLEAIMADAEQIAPAERPSAVR